MNPIFLSSLAAFFRKIKCPQCGRYQFISRENSKDPFRCKFCGHLIETPPKK